MMLPLWTIVTLLRFCRTAYSRAARTRRSVPGLLTGLMPMPIWSAASLPNRIFLNAAGSSRCRNSRIFFASGLPAW